MEFVGWPLEAATAELERRGVCCDVRYARPARDFFPRTDVYYVVRQRKAEGGGVALVAAAKMGKEV